MNDIFATDLAVAASALSDGVRQMMSTSHAPEALARASMLRSMGLAKRCDTCVIASDTSACDPPAGTKTSTIALSPSRTGLQYVDWLTGISAVVKGPYTVPAPPFPAKRISVEGDSRAASRPMRSARAPAEETSHWAAMPSGICTHCRDVLSASGFPLTCRPTPICRRLLDGELFAWRTASIPAASASPSGRRIDRPVPGSIRKASGRAALAEGGIVAKVAQSAADTGTQANASNARRNRVIE